MAEPNKFVWAYFIQTRKEIDTEKRERDQMLNFAVLVLGAIGFAVVQSETAQKYLKHPEAIGIEIAALVIISSLFWIRYKKLQQIADRWFVLHRIVIKHFGKKTSHEMLEGVVSKYLTTWRYIRKDFILNISFSLPIYGMLALQFIDGYRKGDNWRVIISAAIIALHPILSSLILGRKLRDPLPPLKND